jgi:hypothetical protein
MQKHIQKNDTYEQASQADSVYIRVMKAYR